MLVPTPPIILPTLFLDSIAHSGLLTSLNTVVDAGDIRQVSSGASGGPQTLGVLPPGGSHAFFRGNDATVDANRDPTFVGTPGGQSVNEYWSMFSINNGSTPSNRLGTPAASVFSAMHQDSAAFSMAGWLRADGAQQGFQMVATYAATGPGLVWWVVPSGTAGAGSLSLLVVGPAMAVVFNPFSSLTPIYNAPTFYAISVNEASNTMTFMINGNQETLACTYSAPSAAVMELPIFVVTSCIANSASGPTSHTGRLYNFAHWSRALSTTELSTLYNATKGRFGL
jgi:hypothetical protein